MRRQVLRTSSAAPDAELSSFIVAPAVGVAIVRDRTRMTEVESTSHNQGEGVASGYGNGLGAVRGGSVADLAAVVESPTVSFPIARPRTRMPGSGIDAGKLERRCDRHWGRTVRVRAVAKLAARVAPPTISRAIVGQCASMSTPAREFREGETATDAHGYEAARE